MTTFKFFETIKSFMSIYNRCYRAVKKAERKWGIEVSAKEWGQIYDMVARHPHRPIRVLENVLFEDMSMIPNRLSCGGEFVGLETATINTEKIHLSVIDELELGSSFTKVFVKDEAERSFLLNTSNVLLGYYRTNEKYEARRLRDAEIIVRS